MPSYKWEAANGATAPQQPLGEDKMTIIAPPRTDIWRRSSKPEGDVFNAPYIYTIVKPMSFKRLSVTVTVPWKTQFDQGGFIIAFPNSTEPWRWIKGGIEYFNGKPALGVVGTDRYSDWSLAPMSADEQKTATFEAVRDDTTLWVYAVVDGKRQPLRETKWAFLDLEQSAEMRVGVYAAKPTPDKGDEKAGVEVTFSDFVLETEE
jgi:uncharacterized protein